MSDRGARSLPLSKDMRAVLDGVPSESSALCGIAALRFLERFLAGIGSRHVYNHMRWFGDRLPECATSACAGGWSHLLFAACPNPMTFEGPDAAYTALGCFFAISREDALLIFSPDTWNPPTMWPAPEAVARRMRAVLRRAEKATE
jgi:hypothetical protein